MKAGMTYPLLDKAQYNDDHGEGYTFAQVADRFDGEMRLADCWIVDEHGNVHPGNDACPVPVLSEDLDIANGKLTAAAPRKRAAFMGWR